MLQTKIVEIVSELGISQFAGEIYAHLVELKNPSITELCIQTGSYRRKVYEALEELKQAGLIEKENDYSRKIILKSPVVLDTLLKAKKYQLNKVSLEYQDLLPQLVSNFFEDPKQLSIQVFEGTNRFKYLFNILLDQTDEGLEMFSYNESQDLYDILDLDYFLTIWVEKRITKKIFAKVLANSKNQFADFQKKFDNQKYREIRTLKNSHQTQSCIWLLGNKFILWDTFTPKAVMIENQAMSTLFKEMFESIWDRS